MDDFNKNLIKLYEILNLGNSLENTLEYIYRSFNEFIPCDRIAISLLDNMGNVYSYALKTDYEVSLRSGYSLNLLKTSLGNLVKYQTPRIINDYAQYLIDNPLSEPTKLIIEEGIKSSITYPICSNGVCVGVIFFSSKKANAYNYKYLDMVKCLANSLAISIEKNLLVDELILSSITGLAKLVEAKDCDTGLHIERMQEYSRIIATSLSKNKKYKNIIDSKYIRDIHKFSPLHDIGKVGIADGILLKPGKLTTEEFQVIKTHTLIGAEVLKKSSNNLLKSGRHFFDMAIDIVVSHHERFDGTGYPCGLSGYNIPLSAQIVMAADVLDALTSKRVYKQAIDINISMEMMDEEKGKMFDPNIIEALLECKAELLIVHDKFKETVELYR